MRVTYAFAACVVAAIPARAQPVTGFYVQGGAGLTLQQQQSVSLPPGMGIPTPNSADAANAAINDNGRRIAKWQHRLGVRPGAPHGTARRPYFPDRRHVALVTIGEKVGGGDP